jgi:hypothetical protein
MRGYQRQFVKSFKIHSGALFTAVASITGGQMPLQGRETAPAEKAGKIFVMVGLNVDGRPTASLMITPPPAAPLRHCDTLTRELSCSRRYVAWSHHDRGLTVTASKLAGRNVTNVTLFERGCGLIIRHCSNAIYLQQAPDGYG